MEFFTLPVNFVIKNENSWFFIDGKFAVEVRFNKSII